MRKLMKIEGMHCGNCAMNVRSALERVAGVKKAEVDLLQHSVMVEGERLDDQALRAAVADSGYRVLSIIP